MGLARGGGCQAGLPISGWDVGGQQEREIEIWCKGTVRWFQMQKMQGTEVEESIMDTCLTWSQSKLSGAASEILAPSVRHLPHSTPLILRQAEWGSVASLSFPPI